MFNNNLNWDRIPNKIKRAIEISLEHLDEHKFILNDTNTEFIDDYCWDLSKKKLMKKIINKFYFLVTCHLKQLLYMNMVHNKLKSTIKYFRLIKRKSINSFILGLPTQISNLTNLQTLNLTNNHIEVYYQSLS